jgi:repressor LexA
MHLTPRQLDIVRFILNYRARWGFSPTLQEIGDSLGVSAVTVFEHARALKRKGAVRHTPNQARSLEIIDPELQELAEAARDLTIPLVGQIAAGRPIESLENVENVNLAEMLALDRATFMLRVRGDSMISDHIRDGDYVLVEKRGTARDGETVVALLPDGEVTLKRFYREPDRIRLQPANPAMEPIYVNDVQVQGVVVGILRRCWTGPGLPQPRVGKKEVKREEGSTMTASALRSFWKRSVKRAKALGPLPPDVVKRITGRGD